METKNRCAGISLVEVLIASVLMMLSIGATFSFVHSSTDVSESLKAMTQLDQRAHRAIERMVSVLMDAGRVTMPPSPLSQADASGFLFNRAVDFVDGAMVWGPEYRIEYQPDPLDPEDDIDNNGNGLVDEGRVVLILRPGQPDEVLTILASGVAEYLQGEQPNGLDDNGNGLIDEPGLTFELDASTLSIQLTVEKRGPDGRMLRRTVQSSFTVRN